MVNGFISLMSGFSPDPTFTELLGKLDIGVVETRMTINFQATVTEMQNYADNLGNSLGNMLP